MIREQCFTRKWLEDFKKQKEHKSIQVDILERMIYALHLLEKLKSKGLEFTFKGGTSLVLLLKEGTRFSIDIDIVCQAERVAVEKVLHEVVEDSKFSTFVLDENRSYRAGLPKAHYKFLFDSTVNPKVQGGILLDILFTEPIYPETVEVLIDTKWVESETETTVQTPSIDAITGDKLTAFAPNTIGIPYLKGDRDSTTEISKQLYDLGRLFENVTDMKIVAESFRLHAEQGIGFRTARKLGEINVEDVLLDTLETCLTIASREKNPNDEAKKNFKRLERGIRSFGAGYLMKGHFRIENAMAASARVALLAAKILTNDLSPIDYYDGQDIKALTIASAKYAYLNRLKRQPDKSIFYYWFHAIALLTTEI
jgi:hypothetical protein